MSAEGVTENNNVTAIADQFPHLHIEALGAGEVGSVYVTHSSSGEVLKAEAELNYAPFKRMLIDDPEIFKIFGERDESIDIKFLHPMRRFRLDPLEIIEDEDGELDMTSFDIGRLVDITHLPTAAKYGWSENYLSKANPMEEGEVHRRVRQDVELEAQKKSKQQGLKRKSSSTQSPLNHTRMQRKEAAKEETEKAALVKLTKTCGDVKQAVRLDMKPPRHSLLSTSKLRTLASKPEILLNKNSRLSRLPTPESKDIFPSKHVPGVTVSNSPRNGRNTGPIPNTAQGKKMGIIFHQILAKLAESDHATYTDMVTFDRREAAKSEVTRQDFAERVYAFVCKRDIVGLHNAYAEAMKRNGTNRAYHLPVFDEKEGEWGNGMTLADEPEDRRQGTQDSGIYLTAGLGTPDAMFD
ncbi:hypothetical protein DE146DRAFT_789606 [Phaeosphaeria sp. MPI-PUGE-AT-0046c]|nr:hypothetical protein DE146DRAFT_789606 [Phaeosphaeria sp. MPI-PUGE-AT-0046c]